MSFVEYIYLFLSVIVGGGLAFLVSNSNNLIFKLLIPFTGAYILGITVLHLMPIVFHEGSHETGLYILIGFFVQIFLEQLSGGVEHGHIHGSEQMSWNRFLPLFFGLGLHALLEGIPLSVYSDLHQVMHHHEDNHNHLLLGVILHKAPAAFALVSIMRVSKIKTHYILLGLIGFALMSPFGAMLAEYLHPDPDTIVFFTAVIIGLFLHISTTTIFEADERRQHRISWTKIGAIVMGVGLALLTLF